MPDGLAARKLSFAEFEARLRELHLHAEFSTICSQYKTSLKEVWGDRRFAHVVQGRAALMFALRQRKWSLPAIGHLLGRDHTTVLYALRRHVEREPPPPPPGSGLIEDFEATAFTRK